LLSFSYLNFQTYKTAQPNGTKPGRGGPCEEEIQIYTNKVDSPWGEAIRGPKGGS